MTAARAAREAAAERARHARDRLAALRHEQDQLTADRDAAVVELSARGLSYDEIAPLAGISRARVGQVVSGARRRADGEDAVASGDAAVGRL